MSTAISQDATAPVAALRSHRRKIMRGDQLVRCAVFLGLGLVFIAEFLCRSEYNPDFEPYERIYEIAGSNFDATPNGFCFSLFIKASQALELDYLAFRDLLRFTSITLFATALVLVSKWSKDIRPTSRLPFILSVGVALIVGSAAFIFGVEFFLVRIRAGLSISLMALAFSLFLSRPAGFFTRRLISSIILLGLSIGVHAFTGILLFCFLGIPALALVVLNSLKTLFSARLSLALIVGSILTTSSVFLAYLSLIAVEIRGADLVGPLNRFRLWTIGVIPLSMLIVLAVASNRRVIGLVQRSRRSVNGLPKLRDNLGQRRVYWLTLVSVNYGVLAVALCVLDFMGLTQQSGEALVRIFTLSSVPAIYVIFLRPAVVFPLWFFLLASNSLFFVHTIVFPYSTFP